MARILVVLSTAVTTSRKPKTKQEIRRFVSFLVWDNTIVSGESPPSRTFWYPETICSHTVPRSFGPYGDPRLNVHHFSSGGGPTGLPGIAREIPIESAAAQRVGDASISTCAASYPPLSTTARALALPVPRLLIWIPAPPLHELRSRNNAAFNSRNQRQSNPTGFPSEIDSEPMRA
ncbi:hypothetical protein BJ322DRAFT_495039 [Thelephora terrestris]|uniref:Uncharacterized protein n=1 Tax=Thelephora terrestris TaxID=56493 RepID=A0A9P6H3W5_9AGAM|nr:hypothetical protein BJ322DRAFT_495039 [Thelephora terrestris]